MNSLLPFGEYVSPEQRAVETATLETWELERLLLRLAAAGREHRHHRALRHASSSGSRHRRQGSRGEPSAPQPIRDASGGAGGGAGGVSMPWLLPREGGAGMGGAAALPASAPNQGMYPGSWPPTGALEPGSALASAGSSMRDDGHVVSPRSRSGSTSFKSRLASLRLK